MGKPLRCDGCGRFVGIGELTRGLAIHELVYPDSEYTTETWETLCSACYKVEGGERI